MTEKQETFTRAEVEAILMQQHKANIQAVKDHYAEERRNQTPPFWVAGLMLCGLFGALWAIAVWG